MKTLPLIMTFLALSTLFVSVVHATPANEYIQFEAKNLQQVKQALSKGEVSKVTRDAYLYLIKKADSRLSIKNPTVMDKSLYPPSKDKHDYLSISRYWWPDPKSRTGLPWIRNDGVTNPSTQTDDVDRNRLGLMTESLRLLSLAYFFTEDEKYAEKGIAMIDTWFIAGATKMNPHFEFSQSVPGNPKGRRSGILDGRLIPECVLDAITMLSKSVHWTQEKQLSMNAWFAEYLRWLTNSKLGKAGAKQTNNHGSWYRFQVAALSWYLGDEETLAKIISVTKKSFTVQFDEAGAQAHELKRTRGYFYSCFNLKALAYIANLAEKSKHGLWQYQAPTGQSLKLAINYLLPAAQGEPWPHSSKNLDTIYIASLLADSNNNQTTPEYKQTLQSLLKQLTRQETLSPKQKSTLYEFALFQSQYFSKN